MAKRFFIITCTTFLVFLYSQYEKKKINEILVSSEEDLVLKKLPEVSFTALDGEAVNVHTLINNSTNLLVIHFWGTWCAPCEKEFPALIRLLKKFEHDKNVNFILIAVNDDAKKVNKFIKRFSKLMPKLAVYLDNSDAYKNSFGTTRVPETYIFNREARAVKKLIGPQEWDKPYYFNMIKDLSN